MRTRFVIIYPALLMLLTAAATVWCAAPAAPMTFAVTRIRHLRCGAADIDNVCSGDTVTVMAPRARSLALYRREDGRSDRRVLSCPGDVRCRPLGRGWAASWSAEAGRVRVIAADRAVGLGATVDEAMLDAQRAGAVVEYRSFEVR